MATTGNLVDDWFDNTKGVAPQELRTDGEWVWLGDLAYYVEKYAVDLPQEFLEHMARREWIASRLSHEALIQAEEDFFAD